MVIFGYTVALRNSLIPKGLKGEKMFRRERKGERKGKEEKTTGMQKKKKEGDYKIGRKKDINFICSASFVFIYFGIRCMYEIKIEYSMKHGAMVLVK